MRVYRRGDGKVWWVDVHVGGRRWRKTTNCESRREAIQAAKVIKLELELGSPVQPSSQSVQTAFVTWQGEVSTGSRGREEVRRVELFVEWVGEVEMSEVETHTVTRYIHNQLVEERGLSPATVVRHRASLSTFFRWGVAYSVCSTNPVTGSWQPKQDRVKKEPCTIPEVRETLRAVVGSPLEGVYHLAFFAGLRRGEVVRARWEDIDLSAGTIFVRGTKTLGSEATLPLHPSLRKWVKRQGKVEGPVVSTRAGGHYRGDSLENLRRKHPADLPPFHRARHTLATTLAREGVPLERIRELLRHTSVSTTERYYAWACPSSRGTELGKFKV